MKRWKTTLGLASALTLALTPMMADAATTEEVQLREQLEQLQAQVQQLQVQQNDTWQNERRAEEMKSLIREVLSDADTRASLLESGVTAGHNGKNFFLASEDGGFLMKISGQLQLRYVATFQDQGTDGSTGSFIEDEDEAGMTVRRAKIKFAGHIADPRLKYALQLSVDRHTNTVRADTIVISYEIADGWTLWGGEDKAPFLREELTSSKRQLTVERSYINEIFTVDRVQGVGLVYHGDENLRFAVMVSDGSRSGDASGPADVFTQSVNGRVKAKDFDDDDADFAVTSRVDYKIAGNWSQMKDFTTWSDEDMAAFIGAAVHYEVGETGDTGLNNNSFSWTVDASVENNGFSLFGAFIAKYTDYDEAALASDVDLWGVVVKAGYFVVPDKCEVFAQYEYVDFDAFFGDPVDEVTILTLGFNHYLNKHDAKFTLDVQYAFDPIPLGQSGLGLQVDNPDSGEQVVLRAQFQLLF